MIKYNTRKNRHTVDHNYKFGDNIMLTKQTAYKYETPYTGPFVITQCFNNVTMNVQCGQNKLGIIYVASSHINMILMLNILTPKICLTVSTYELPVIYFCVDVKAWK